MNKLIEAASIPVGIGGLYVLYCAAANIMYGEPLSEFARILTQVYIYGICMAPVVGVVVLGCTIARQFRQPKRLGIIRFDQCGNLYYDR